MNTESGIKQTNQQTAVNTVARPGLIQAGPLAPITSGTLGHRGVVEYSKSAAAMVSETYVVATKK